MIIKLMAHDGDKFPTTRLLQAKEVNYRYAVYPFDGTEMLGEYQVPFGEPTPGTCLVIDLDRDEKSATPYVLKNATVFIMNDEGKTVDRINID